MKNIIVTVIGLFFAASLLAAGEEVFYETNFNTPASLTNWFKAPNMTLETTGGIDNSGCVKFTSDSENNGNLSTIRLDANKLQGRSVTLEGWIKAENVSKPKAAYLGPKLMLSVTYGDNQKMYPDQEKKIGTYDWQKFTVFVRIPRSASKVDLSIGLQNAVGTVYFDDVKVILLPAPAEAAAAKPAALPGTQTTQFRGVMSGGDLSPAAFKELHEVWNANLIRFQIGRKSGEDHTTAEGFRQIVTRGLAELDAILPAARQNNIKILIDMHVGPGTSLDKLLSNKLSWDPKMQQLLADIWREIAAKYKNEPVIWGYDLLNEPREDNYVYTPDGGLDWNRLAEKVAKSVREVDPVKPIIVEAAQWANPAGFENLIPINVPNVIYSVHLYAPHEYTHQGVNNNPSDVTYPGMIAGKMWDKAALEKELAPVIAFQQKYKVPIYVGEFGVARWAPGAEQWLDDVISIFEANGWDWTYHAFREYDGWDAEISGDKANPQRVKDTPRRAVLLKYMKKNGNSESLKSQLDLPVSVPAANAKPDKEFRVLFIGDSITLHGTSDDTKAKLKWSIVAGMAASAPDKDYVSLFAKVLQQKYPGREIKIVYHTGGGGTAAGRLAAAEPFLKSKPDMVVIQLGEHEKEADGIDQFADNYRKLLTAFANLSPRPVILCTGVWNPSAKGRIDHYTNWPQALDEAMQSECQKLNIPFAPVAKYALDPNCSGTGGSPGVQWHPNDAGMQGYADALTAALQQVK